MNALLAAKTLITITPSIDRYCEILEKTNTVRATHSYSSLLDTEVLCQKIIDQTYRVNYLRRLRQSIDSLINSMPEKYETVLKLYYCNKNTTLIIANHLRISERTVFRLVNEATQYFADRLDKLSINTFTFKTLLEQNKWIQSEYEKIARDNENLIIQKN